MSNLRIAVVPILILGVKGQMSLWEGCDSGNYYKNGSAIVSYCQLLSLYTLLITDKSYTLQKTMYPVDYLMVLI